MKRILEKVEATGPHHPFNWQENRENKKTVINNFNALIQTEVTEDNFQQFEERYDGLVNWWYSKEQDYLMMEEERIQQELKIEQEKQRLAEHMKSIREEQQKKLAEAKKQTELNAQAIIENSPPSTLTGKRKLSNIFEEVGQDISSQLPPSKRSKTTATNLGEHIMLRIC